jgi:hypothetical protein
MFIIYNVHTGTCIASYTFQPRCSGVVDKTRSSYLLNDVRTQSFFRYEFIFFGVVIFRVFSFLLFLVLYFLFVCSLLEELTEESMSLFTYTQRPYEAESASSEEENSDSDFGIKGNIYMYVLLCFRV